MVGAKIRVLVVDDSALMRKMITDYLKTASGIEVAGTASDGRQAVEMVRQLQPNVVTLDIQMPGMDGLQALDAILQVRPTAVIMVSSLTQAGAAITLDALERGAIDYVSKPESGLAAREVLGADLVRKIRAAASVDIARIVRNRRRMAPPRAVSSGAASSPASPPTKCAPGNEPPGLIHTCIAIGISTGGPPALTALLAGLRPPMPPIVIVQHMPAQFTKAFAWRLNSCSPLSVAEGKNGDALRCNSVYIAPGGFHMAVRGNRGTARLRVFDGEPVSGHKPSVDVLMKSVAQVFGRIVLGVIMTGMGRDGAQGCRDIRSAGGYVLGQDEATSDVYGMNKVAYVEGNVDRQFPLPEGARMITQFVEQRFLSPALAR